MEDRAGMLPTDLNKRIQRAACSTDNPAAGHRRENGRNVLQVLSRREPNPKGQGQVEADSSQNKANCESLMA